MNLMGALMVISVRALTKRLYALLRRSKYNYSRAEGYVMNAEWVASQTMRYFRFTHFRSPKRFC